MDKDLISRKELLEWLMPYIHADEKVDASDIVVDIKARPGIEAYTEQDVREAYNSGYSCGKEQAVRHGRWIPADGEGKNPCDEWDCSACNERRTFMVEMDADDMKEYYKFCPNCGARMDGGVDDALN